MKKKKKKILRWVLYVFLLCIITGTFLLYKAYLKVYETNTAFDKDYVYLFVPTGSDYNDLIEIIKNQGIVDDFTSFEYLADIKNLKNNVHPGKYRINKGMNNNEIINLLRSGSQEPVKVSFHVIRTKEQLAGVATRNIECDSIELLSLLNNPEQAAKYGFTPTTFFTMFIPNTYEFYWNTSGEQFIERMAKEYKKFWTEERKSKAKEMNLSQSEVSILASIVQEETNKTDEMPDIAGVYINRLKKGMLLQADPTVKFAAKDWSIKRVLNKHKEIDSPYNTYKYKGLPPGPISLPSITALDAVLYYTKHDYLFFCAKEDFSGYHYFSKTLKQHNIYANRYRNALNKNKIWK